MLLNILMLSLRRTPELALPNPVWMYVMNCIETEGDFLKEWSYLHLPNKILELKHKEKDFFFQKTQNLDAYLSFTKLFKSNRVLFASEMLSSVSGQGSDKRTSLSDFHLLWFPKPSCKYHKNNLTYSFWLLALLINWWED